MFIGQYVAEFESLNNRAKVYDMVLPETVLAYKFLKECIYINLQRKTHQQHQLNSLTTQWNNI